MTPTTRGMPVGVIGAGVSGITTALLLQLNGISTRIYALERPPRGLRPKRRPPGFPTLHAAATVVPHSVRSPKLQQRTADSQSIFRALAYVADFGVRTHTLYELFESPESELPAYAEAVANFRLMSPAELDDPRSPRRAEADQVHGWRFDGYFCEAHTYIGRLLELYERLGGQLVSLAEASVDTHLVSYLALGHALLVNCSGQGSASLLDQDHLHGVEDLPEDPLFEPLVDQWPQRIVRGHYIHVAIPKMLLDTSGRFMAYNYTPHPDVYPAGSGHAGDVYCYPRSDAWMLGGSRQLRVTTPDGESWEGADAAGEGVSFPSLDGSSVTVPRPLFSLNDALIEQVTGGAISMRRLHAEEPDRFTAGIGHRFERAHPTDSIRLACSRVAFNGNEHVVIHNYGHGGAGYTLSWGCALEVLDLVGAVRDAGVPVQEAQPLESPAGSFGAVVDLIRDTLSMREPLSNA